MNAYVTTVLKRSEEARLLMLACVYSSAAELQLPEDTIHGLLD